MRLALPVMAAMLLSACASTPPVQAPADTPIVRPPVQTRPVVISVPPPPVEGFRNPEVMQGPGLAGVIQEGANSLLAQFGTPRLDVAEGDMRKLQFTTRACVMDIYLYPLRPDAEPVATWVETRRSSDGAQVDMVACMQAIREAR